MKNLTRILALVLVFTMMVSSAAFAAKFTDVAEDSTYAEAVEVLSSLGIINGYEDGTFKPDAVITRAEVVAIVNRLQGLSDAAKAAAGTSMYTDVATSDWFAGDVNLASQMGIVAGDGNGLFRPNDQVKYEEAVKMMVAALGYNQEYVLKQGGWPTGYLVIATDKGVTKGLAVSAGEPAHRGVVAKLAYQSLTAPMMVLYTYDDEGKATYASDDTKTLLGTKLGFAKAIGHVVMNEVSSLTSTSQSEKGYISYKLESLDKVTSTTNKNVDGYKHFVGNTNVADVKAVINNISVGATDVADTLGLATEIYLGLNDDDEAEVLTYIVSKKNNVVATIEKTADIQTSGKYASTLTVDGDLLDGVISVYDDEVDSTNTEYKVEDANIIYNGAWVSANGFTFPTMGAAELLDNNADGKYDYIYVVEYETKVVDTVYGGNKKIGMKVGSTIDLTNFIEEKDGYTYSITLDGEEIEITDLQEYDVLSVAAARTGKSIEIIVSRNVVEGAVESIDPNANKFKEVYQIAGSEYKIGNVGLANVPTITSSTEGKFYIDAFGKIAMTEADNSISGNLAFIQGIGDYKSMGATEYEVEVLNKDGSVEIYNLADNVTVKTNATLVGKEGKAAVAARITALMGTNTAEAFAKRLVSYKANASGKITAISFVDALAGEGLSFAAGNAADEYDASVNSLKYGVTDATVIFYLPVAQNGTVDKDDFKVTDISMLVDEKTYDTAYLDIDKDLNAGVMVIASESISIGEESALALVTGSVISTNEEGDRVITVSFLQNGEEKTLSVDSEAAVNDVDNNPFVRGAAFEYSVNAEGDIDDAKFCGPVNTIALTPAQVEAAAAAGNVFATAKADNLDYQYIAGYVTAKNGSTLTLNTAFDGVGGAKVAIPSTANVYVMDVTKSKIIPSVAAIGDVVACKYYTENGVNYAEEEADTYVIIKYIDKEIVDVVAYYGFAPQN